jgi:hypothetical protein
MGSIPIPSQNGEVRLMAGLQKGESSPKTLILFYYYSMLKEVMAILIEIHASVKTKSTHGVFEKPIAIESGNTSLPNQAYAKVEKFARQDIPVGSYSIKKFLEMADESYQMNARYAVRHIPSKIIMAVPYGHLKQYQNGKYEVVITPLSR